MGVEAQRDARQAPAEVGVAGPLDPDRVLFLIEDDDPPPPAVVGGDSSRRALADRVALDLVEPPAAGRRSEADTASMSVALDEMPELVAVLDDAPVLARVAGPEALRVMRGRGGVVVRLHAPQWSLIVRVGGPVLVVLDMMPTHALRLDDDLDWVPEVRGMVDAVLVELDRHVPTVPGGAAGSSTAPRVVSRR